MCSSDEEAEAEEAKHVADHVADHVGVTKKNQKDSIDLTEHVEESSKEGENHDVVATEGIEEAVEAVKDDEGRPKKRLRQSKG